MAALLPVILFECNGQAPAPSKDFYQLVVCRSEVILRWWKISLRSEFRDTKPGELKESHLDFVDDTTLQAQVGIIFGQKTLQYVINLCRGQYDFLERLPEPLILYILTFLDLEDIAQLSQVSHTFQKDPDFPEAARRQQSCKNREERRARTGAASQSLMKILIVPECLPFTGAATYVQICNSEKLWEHIVERSCDRVTPEMRSLAQDIGWKQFFFTNKLQLQLQLRRWRKRQEDGQNILFRSEDEPLAEGW